MDVTLEQLLEAGAHFGHHSRRWNPKMAPYIYGVKDGVHVFDLVKTRENLLIALEELKNAAREGKIILFVGTKKQAKDKLKEIATNAGYPYINERWLGGTLTNFNQIAKSVKKLSELHDELRQSDISYTKKERLLMARHMEKLQRFVGGLTTLTKIPDLIVIIDTHKEKGAVYEAKKMNVKTIGIVDTNADPDEVTFPVPMNDDSEGSVNFLLDLFEKAIAEGKKPSAAPKAKKAKKVKKEKKIKK